ncbi:MAG TPA: glycoside hydrolase family 2 TIM barrel-domain containing protein [Opitutus sp.]|nr:glycoside hydrolase family 2 TIM barrel-domain containing protein [Opitutus sp.]
MVAPLDRGWSFRRLSPAENGAARTVDLPHIPFVADLDGRHHWFGECSYTRTITRPPGAPDGPCALHVGAAMHSAVVLVDGRERGRHTGGYLPFEIDLTEALRDGRPHELELRLDNRDNPGVPPGKPYADLDFCWYGGLYRSAELRFRPALHLTDPVGAGVVAGGGIFVRTLAIAPDSAVIDVRTHVRNAGAVDRTFDVAIEILDGSRPAARGRCTHQRVKAGASATIAVEVNVPRPLLWQPDQPHLYHARVTLRDAEDRPLDQAAVRFGIRQIQFSRTGGFRINGRRLRARGTNRHQDYPRAGYAVPPAAHRRDLRRLKEAGFDYVRLAHYPQSPEVLDACDELGVLAMVCLPGWQFMGGEAFRAACFQNARDLIRRDRNHPAVVLWELSLNETEMDDAFMARLHAIGHEEYPGDQMFTCGWQDRFDVFTHSRQHGRIHDWRNGDKALVIAEYGDWEFYASTAGFNQKTGEGVYPRAGNARKRRADGEAGMRQQVRNHLVALNDTLGSPAVLDGQWSMFDYARGYDPERAACGIMDVFRLPKFSYHFYRSQRDATSDGGALWTGGPVIFIASHWQPGSDLEIPVFTNCEEVELRLNGRAVARLSPARDDSNAHLPHPPCVFRLPAFVPGTLEAVGYIGGQPAAAHRVATPGAPARIELEIDTGGVFAGPDAPDLLIAHARIVDARGSLCLDAVSPIAFSLEGSAEIVGPDATPAEAGIASTVLRLPAGCPAFTLRARCSAVPGLAPGACDWQPPAPAAAGAAAASRVAATAFK